MKTTKIHQIYIPIFIEIIGVDLMYILKRLGIFLKNYGLMMNQSMNSAAAVNNYRSYKKLPMRIIWPLLIQYDHGMLVSIIEHPPSLMMGEVNTLIYMSLFIFTLVSFT